MLTKLEKKSRVERHPKVAFVNQPITYEIGLDSALASKVPLPVVKEASSIKKS